MQAHGISDSMWQMYRPLAYKDAWSTLIMLLRFVSLLDQSLTYTADYRQGK
jgi:hypothetical protein